MHVYKRSKTLLLSAAKTPGPALHHSQRLEVRRLHTALEDPHRKQPHVPSYQQINCVDSIIRSDVQCAQGFLLILQALCQVKFTPSKNTILVFLNFFSFTTCRYLESCSGPALKRKSESLSIATSSSSTTSEEDKTPAVQLEDGANADGNGDSPVAAGAACHFFKNFNNCRRIAN